MRFAVQIGSQVFLSLFTFLLLWLFSFNLVEKSHLKKKVVHGTLARDHRDPVETHTISVKNESQRSKDNQDESSAGGQVRTLAQEIDVERQIFQRIPKRNVAEFSFCSLSHRVPTIHTLRSS